MIEDALKLFVIEYSVTTDATHIRTLGSVIENNRKNLATGLASNYLPIGLFQTREEADAFYVEFYKVLAQDASIQSRNWSHVSEVVDRLLPSLLSKSGPAKEEY